MTIQQAIQKAIVEGGYRGDYQIEINNGEVFTFGKKIVENDVLLDPTFWQSLGKAMGWDCDNPDHEHIEKMSRTELGRLGCPTCKMDGTKEWLAHWHRFIDHLAEGKSIESFFEAIN